TPNGKVDRSALPQPPASRPKLDQPYVPPRTPEEISLAHLWSEVLRIDPIGIHDNFFELGGDSLMLTQLAWKITEEFAVDIPLVELFTKLTMAELIPTLEEMRSRNCSSLPSALAGELGMRAPAEREA